MAQLTHADKKAFVASVSNTLKNNGDAFAGKDFDPVARSAALDGALDTVNKKVGLRQTAEAALTSAVTVENKAIDDAYNLASNAVDGVSSALTAQHPLTQQLRKLRGSMHHNGAMPAPAPVK